MINKTFQNKHKTKDFLNMMRRSDTNHFVNTNIIKHKQQTVFLNEINHKQFDTMFVTIKFDLVQFFSLVSYK